MNYIPGQGTSRYRSWGIYFQITQKSNLDDAVDGLDEKGKMKDGAKWEAKELARVRDRKLTKYRRTRYYELRSALEKNRDTLKYQITKKSSEMRKKYE